MFPSITLPYAQIAMLISGAADFFLTALGSLRSPFLLGVLHPIRLAATIGAFSSLLPLVVGLRKRGRLDKGLKLLTLLLLIAVLSEIVSYSMVWMFKYNQIVYSLFTPVEFALLTLMFRYWLPHERLKKILTWSIPLFIVLWVGVETWQLIQEGWKTWLVTQLAINDYLLSVQSVFFIIISIATLLHIINDVTAPVVQNPIFWVTTAILFYFTGNLFIFAFQGIILVTGSSLLIIWYLHSALNLLKSILYTIGLVIAGKISGEKRQDEAIEPA